jgi:hypothetical protein
MKKLLLSLMFGCVFANANAQIVTKNTRDTAQTTMYRYITYQCRQQAFNMCFHLFTVSDDGVNLYQVNVKDESCNMSRSEATEAVKLGYYDNGWRNLRCN